MDPSSPLRAWLAAIGSLLFPGLGQLAAGQFRRAHALVVLDAVVVLVVYAWSLLGYMPLPAFALSLPVLACVAWRGWAARDALRANRVRLEGRPRYSRRIWAGVIAAFVATELAVTWATDHVGWTYIGHPFRISGSTMAPTLVAGDFLSVRPIGQRAVHRGDVVVFRWPEDTSQSFIQRVVGLSGDTLAMRAGVLEVNGRREQESYTVRDSTPDDTGEMFVWQEKYSLPGIRQASSHRPSRDNWGPIVVPDGSYFMLGDNRNSAADSRHWGFVRDELLFGVPWQIYFSANPRTGAVRLERIGRRYVRLSDAQ